MMDAQKETQRETLLVKLLDALSPDNAAIKAIKQAEEQAKKDIKEIKARNPELEKEIEDSKNVLTNLEKYKNFHLSFAEESVNIVNLVPDFLTYDYNKFVEESREAYDFYNDKLKAAEKEKKENEKRLTEANEIVSETPAKLKGEKDKIAPINALIEQKLKGEVKYLNGERLDEMLNKLGIFDEDEISLIVPAISYPDDLGFRSIYINYNSEERNTQSVGSIISTAFEHAEDDKNKVVDVAPVNQNTQEDSEVLQYLSDVFGISETDAKLRPKVLEIPLDKLKENAEKLINANIDPKAVRMETLINDRVDNVVGNVEVFENMAYPLDDMTVKKEIVSLDEITPLTTSKAIGLITESGLSLRKRDGKIAVEAITKDLPKLRNAIKLAAAVDITYFSEHPEKLSVIVSEVLARILYCQQNGINYKDSNGNFESFIESDKEWHDIYGDEGQISILPTTKPTTEQLVDEISDEGLKALKEANDIDNYIRYTKVDDDKVEEYQDIIQTISQINTSANPVVIEIGQYKFLSSAVNKNIIYLLNGNVKDSKEQIILGALAYRNPLPVDALEKLKIAINPNTIGLSQK